MSVKRGERIDVLLVERGWFKSRARAQAAVMEGAVFVDGHRVFKSGERLSDDVHIEVRAESQPYASRGGLKIERPMDIFPIEVKGKVILDAGASTGGFTDYLLRRGATRVYAVDVGYGQLDWRLRCDERVVVMERTNIRHLTPDRLDGPVDFVTADLSFISLRKVLAPLCSLLRTGGEMLALVKPQFEAGRGQVGRGGVVRDSKVRARALDDVFVVAIQLSLRPLGLTYSPIRGPKGNIEFWMWFAKDPDGMDALGLGHGRGEERFQEMQQQISNVVEEAEEATRPHSTNSRRDSTDGGD